MSFYINLSGCLNMIYGAFKKWLYRLIKQETYFIWQKFNCCSSSYILLSPCSVQFSSVAQSCLTICDLMDCSTSGLPVPSANPEACSNSCPLSHWCHPTISFSFVLFSSCLQSFPESGSFPMRQSAASGGQILEFQLQYQSFKWIFRTDFL